MDLTSQQHLFTCLSCSIAFLSADEQRVHYRSDHHRYNMKRRVASLPPISAAVFNQKVLDRRQETAVMSSLKGSSCETCGKTYTTENAYRSHIQSKKHKENEFKAASQPHSSESQQDEVPSAHVDPPQSSPPPLISETFLPKTSTLSVPETVTENEINETIDAKIAAARSRLSPTSCLFCTHTSPSLSENLTHMASAHSFFIPDADYLINLPGLITYLGEKIAVGNVCIYCNGKGRELRTLEAARKHMLDKAHCKIAYDTEDDRLEVSDFYDFTASYPTETRKKKSSQPRPEDQEWEDMDNDGSEAEEILDENNSQPPESESDSDENIPDNQITYGDTEYELVLPSGARIGHRSMKRYYAQSFRPTHVNKDEDHNSGVALVRRLLADKNSALVPRGAGFGAFGQGTEVVKARNRGEAREAGRHVREFRDQKRREDFKTRVAFIHNSQKHFRDPLLQ